MASCINTTFPPVAGGHSRYRTWPFALLGKGMWGAEISRSFSGLCHLAHSLPCQEEDVVQEAAVRSDSVSEWELWVSATKAKQQPPDAWSKWKSCCYQPLKLGGYFLLQQNWLLHHLMAYQVISYSQELCWGQQRRIQVYSMTEVPKTLE